MTKRRSQIYETECQGEETFKHISNTWIMCPEAKGGGIEHEESVKSVVSQHSSPNVDWRDHHPDVPLYLKVCPLYIITNMFFAITAETSSCPRSTSIEAE
jgi:hypothetical protein